jgi:hypothetical protein
MPKKKKGKKGKKGKKDAAPAEPPPPPPPRVPVWPHGAVPEWQRVEGDVGAAVPEWQRLPEVVSTPPADAKLCYDRFRISPADQGQSRLEDSLSSTTSVLSGRKELRSVVESAYNGIAALSTASLKERLARQGMASRGSGSELRARLGAFAAASALARIARAEGVGEDRIREARVGDTDGDGVDTETLEALTTLIVTERANRQEAAVDAARVATEGPLCCACTHIQCASLPTTHIQWLMACAQKKSQRPEARLFSSHRPSKAPHRSVRQRKPRPCGH